MLDWAYDGRVGQGRFSKSISRSEWVRLDEALLAAGFWVISPEEERRGVLLDGADWTIEGRRRDVYRLVRRGSPSGAIYNLGRIFLDIAGPPIAAYYAASAATDASYAARAAASDEELATAAEAVVQILIEMKAPGTAWLDLTPMPNAT